MKRLAFVALAVFSGFELQAGMFNTNLIVNGDAEAGAGSPLGNTAMPVPGWITTNGFTATIYGAAADIPTNCPGPANRGTNLFTGGYGSLPSSAYQLIDLSSAVNLIDAGAVLAEISGYLGGWQSQDDRSELKAEFLDGVHTNVLAAFTIGPVMAVERTNVTALLFREKMLAAPIGARKVKLTLIMTYTTGNYTDGYADNLSFVLTTNRPRLALQGDANYVVKWPTNFADGFVLQSATNLASTNWLNVKNVLTTAAGTNQVTVPKAGGNTFFRLRHPWPTAVRRHGGQYASDTQMQLVPVTRNPARLIDIFSKMPRLKH